MPLKPSLLLVGPMVALTFLVGSALPQEKPKLTDEFIERFASDLEKLGKQFGVTPKAYFESTPPPEVLAVLEAAGIAVVVGEPPYRDSRRDVAMVAGGKVEAAFPATGFSASAVQKNTIKNFLVAVRDFMKSLAQDSPVEVEGFTVNVPPVGSLNFKFK